MAGARRLLVSLALGLACTREPGAAPSPAAPSLPAHAAVGSLAELAPATAAAFADTPHFAPLREPGPDDWLASRHEPGQTVAQYLARGPTRPSPERHIIYLQPIGPLTPLVPSIETLAGYTEAFFGLEVGVLEPISVESLGVATREWDYGPQLPTKPVLDELARRLPADAFLLVGVTMTDLYPDDDWNYVFGFASFDQRVAIYSMLRFDPLVEDPRLKLDDEQRRAIILERSFKLMTHELTHAFGMRHGLLGFDPRERYRRLGERYQAHALTDEANWIAARLTYLGEFAGP